MPTYAYRCEVCGADREEIFPIGQAPERLICTGHAQNNVIKAEPTMGRNYKAEGVSVDAAVGSIRRDFATTDKANATVRDILPSSEDFLRKHRGDRRKANKEIREWNARHEPADTRGNVYRPKEI